MNHLLTAAPDAREDALKVPAPSGQRGWPCFPSEGNKKSSSSPSCAKHTGSPSGKWQHYTSEHQLCKIMHAYTQGRGGIQLLPVVADISFPVCACKLPEIPKGRDMQGQRDYLPLTLLLCMKTSHSKDNLKWVYNTEHRLGIPCWIQFHNPATPYALVVSLLVYEGGKNQVPNMQLRHHHTVRVFL